MVDHLENGLQHADDGAVGAVHAFVEPAQAVEVTEEFVGAVDEVNDHLQVNLSSRRTVRRLRRRFYAVRTDDHLERRKSARSFPPD